MASLPPTPAPTGNTNPAPLKTIGGATATATVSAKAIVLTAPGVGTITLGPDEHPPDIAFPSEMKIAVHYLIGGGTYKQPMGLVLDDVVWEGDLFDSESTTAEERMLAFEQLEASGATVTLKWLFRRLSVIVKSFKPDYQSEHWVKYRIELEVVADLANRYGGSGGLAAATTRSQTNALIAQFNASAAAMAANDPNGGGATAATAAMAVVGATPSPGSSGTSSFLAQAAQQVAKLQTYVAQAAAYLPDAQLATAYNALYSLQLIAQNVKVGGSPQQVLVSTGTSFAELSSRYYGSPDLADQLRQANGAVSNVVRAGTLVSVPAFSAPVSSAAG